MKSRRLGMRLGCSLIVACLVSGLCAPALAYGEDVDRPLRVWEDNRASSGYERYDWQCYNHAYSLGNHWYFVVGWFNHKTPSDPGDGMDLLRALKLDSDADQLPLILLLSRTVSANPDAPASCYWLKLQPFDPATVGPDAHVYGDSSCVHGEVHTYECMRTGEDYLYDYQDYVAAFGKQPPLPPGWAYTSDYSAMEDTSDSYNYGNGLFTAGGYRVVFDDRLQASALEGLVKELRGQYLTDEGRALYTEGSVRALETACSSAESASGEHAVARAYEELMDANRDMKLQSEAAAQQAAGQQAQAEREAAQRAEAERQAAAKRAEEVAAKQKEEEAKAAKKKKDAFDKGLEALKAIRELLEASPSKPLQEIAEKAGIPLDVVELGKAFYDAQYTHEPGKVNPKIYDIVGKMAEMYGGLVLGDEGGTFCSEAIQGTMAGIQGAAENSKIAVEAFDETGDVDAALKKAYGQHYHNTVP